jgi:diguanylate cyclase (GGDEF)-like protein
VGRDHPYRLCSACLRGALIAATLLVLAGAAVALAPGPTPPAVATAWVLARVAAQLLAIRVIAVRVRGRREDRAGWTFVGAAIASWSAADVIDVATQAGILGGTAPVPFWLATYMLLYAGLVLLIRPLLARREAALWLDGLIAGLAIATLVAAAVHGLRSTIHQSGLELYITVAYPVADVVLVGMAAGACAVTAWRPPPAWRWLAGGMVAMLVADVWYAFMWTTDGYTYGDGAPLEGAWSLALIAFAVAARTPATPAIQPPVRLWGTSALPATVLALVSALLVGDHWRHTSDVAAILGVGALAAVGVRSVLTVRELRQLALSRREALTDELTGLANRRALLRAAAEACAEPKPRAALLLCDLDGFKDFNDTLGHEAGDQLLREAGLRIRRVVGADGLTARLGGDEFAILAPGAGPDEAIELAERLRRELVLPLPVAGIAARLEASVGVALLPDHSRAAAGLLRRADVAMYQAKATRSGTEVYDAARDLHSRERLVLAGELRDAVEGGRLDVHFQPKVRVDGGGVVGAEALVRWPHPDRGLLYPDAFLAAAEQAGLMRPLTLVVLDRALAACGRWTAAGRQLGVAVNLSASNLLDASLPDEVAAMLERHGVAPEQLTLEVTEGTILANPLASGEVVAALRRLGVAVSLDDFGTGHSSLSHVKRLPVDELKIDRAFVTDLVADPTNLAIVASIIRLAHSLGMTVTAEGVECEEALCVLAQEGCDLAQGYLFSRPLPEEAFAEWLSARSLTTPGLPARSRVSS